MRYKEMLRSVFLLFLVMTIGASCSDKSSILEENDPDGDPQGIVQYEGEWYQTGDTIYGFKNYIKLVVGDADVPLLLGIPHDGRMAGNPEIPESGTTGGDLNTRPFTLGIADLFKEDTGLQPWIIINEIGRRRVDPNTYPEDVAGRYGTDSDARETYDSYHELLLLARSTMVTNLSNTVGGLFVDMHGHAHRYVRDPEDHVEPYINVINGNTAYSNFIDQSELGYAIASADLETTNDNNYLNTRRERSSIAGLAKAHPSVPFWELIRGEYSFGAMLEAEGVSSVPSPRLPFLDRNATLFGRDSNGRANRRPYFNGGFVTRRYGTATVGTTVGLDDKVSAIQIESPGITVRNNANIMARSTHQFKRAIINYLNHWYGYNYTNSDYPYEFYW